MMFLGCICVCKRDEALLPLFIETWEELYDIPFVVFNDREDPAEVDSLYETIPVHWSGNKNLPQGVLEALQTVSDRAQFLIKLDVDCLHLSREWLATFNHSNVAFGYQNKDVPDCFRGACYVIKSDILSQLALYGGCKHKAEDIGISRAIRALYPNQLQLFPAQSGYQMIAGWEADVDIDRYKKCQIIHLGQNLPREQLVTQMKLLKTYLS